MAVIILYGSYFKETVSKVTDRNVLRSLGEFIKFKQASPLAPFGSSDKSNPPGTPAAQSVPKIRHAHLTHDVSVFYTVSGNPTTLRLYAVLTHDQSGTAKGNMNPRTQQNMAKKLATNKF